MEEQIKEELEKIYKNFKIKVEFVDFRKYKIILEIDTKKCEFEYTYNVNFTKDYNISIICYNIDKKILQYFKKEEIKND
jgi:hypothetical protein